LFGAVNMMFGGGCQQSSCELASALLKKLPQGLTEGTDASGANRFYTDNNHTHALTWLNTN
jgi:hypothetical protein